MEVWELLSSGVQRSAPGNDLWTLSCSPGRDGLSEQIGYERKDELQPLMLFCSEEGPCNRCPSSNTSGSWVSHKSGAKWRVSLCSGGYHRALQRRRNWASALTAGQPERAHDLLLTEPRRAEFPHAGEWEEKQQRI